MIEGAKVGVTSTAGTGVITSGFSVVNSDSDPADFFFSDDENLTVVSSNGEAALKRAKYLQGASVTLDKLIGVNLTFALDGGQYILNYHLGDSNETYEVYIETEERASMSEAAVAIPAKDIDEPIEYSLIQRVWQKAMDSDGGIFYENVDTVIETGTYCVKTDYFDVIRAGDYEAKVKQIAAAAENYGMAAKALLKNTEAEDVDYTPSDYVPDIDGLTSSFTVPESVVVEGDSVEGQDKAVLSYYGSSLLLRGEAVQRHYFTVENSSHESNYLVSRSDDVINEWGYSDNDSSFNYFEDGVFMYFDGNSMSADALTQTTDFTISVYAYPDETELMTFSYNPMDYVYAVLHSDKTDDKTKALVTAFYYYAQEAAMYNAIEISDMEED